MKGQGNGLGLAVICVAGTLARVPTAEAQDAKAAVLAGLEARRSAYAALSREIWELAEVGYQETRSSERLQRELKAAGFEIQTGVAAIPTAFVASFGRGKPVIGLLGEFDALPGLSQDAIPERRPLAEGAPGHGCGHHAFGTASAAAAIAIKDWLATSKTPGTVRFFGTPAEEGGGGKVYMIRAGLFEDVDAVLSWHPSDRNDASPATTLANISAKFRFRGAAAHASVAPHQGRSALDGVEAMDYMVNLMREHVPSDARIHYVITRGGDAPNIVPSQAEVYYYARHPDIRTLDGIWARIVKASEGAALGTGTTVEHELINAVYNRLPNETIGKLMDANLRRVGGYEYSAAEQVFAEKLRTSLESPDLPIGSQESVQPSRAAISGGSTDVGDVSWVVPTAEMTAATWVPGTPAHSWQAVAAGGMSIGVNGLMIAAKTLALTGVDLFSNAAAVREARAELSKKQGPGFVYKARVGDRQPPLDYRK